MTCGGEKRESLLTIYEQIDRASVDAWYNAAIEAGAKDNGKPGLRPHYHAHYYGAFVLVSGLGKELYAESRGPGRP